jgi:hypothetical protein
MNIVGYKRINIFCHIVVIFILISLLVMQASAVAIKSGQVRAHSNGGWAAVDQKITGLVPGTTAAVVLSGWSFDSDFPSDGQTAIWLWDITNNYWATEFPVSNTGEINVRFIGLYSDTNPFDFLVNYVVMGQEGGAVNLPPVIDTNYFGTYGFCPGGWGLVECHVTDDYGVSSVKVNGANMTLYRGDSKDGVWRCWIDGTSTVYGDCMNFTFDVIDTAGKTATLSGLYSQCWVFDVACYDHPLPILP